MGDDGRGHTSNETGREVKSCVLTAGEGALRLARRRENLLDGDLVPLYQKKHWIRRNYHAHTANLAIVYGTCLNRIGPKLHISAQVLSHGMPRTQRRKQPALPPAEFAGSLKPIR